VGYLDSMMSRLLLFLGLSVLMGCASEKRMGESRVQFRRYSKGVHVQHHRDHTPNPARAQQSPAAVDKQAAFQSSPIEGELSAEVNWADAMDQRRGGLSASANNEGPLILATEVADNVSHRSSHPLEKAKRRSAIALTDSRILPDPVHGRHPNAVPGFLLSLGWILGLLAEGAITYLQVPISGAAIGLGILASIFGYFLSRKSFRMSREHPDLYPRFKLSRASRWIAASIFAPVALYVALVIVVVLLLGGL